MPTRRKAPQTPVPSPAKVATALARPTGIPGLTNDQLLRLFSAVIADSPLSIVITDSNGLIEYVNPYTETVSGYSAAELIGKGASIFSAGETPAPVHAAMWATLKSGQAWTGEFRNKRKGGEYFWETATIFPIAGDDGESVRYVAVREDITHRKLTEEKLQESEERLRLALDAANQGWFDVDLRTGKVTASPEYVRLIGFDPEEFSTDLPTWISQVHPDDREILTRAFQACIESGGQDTIEYRRRAKSGEWKWIGSTAKIVAWDDRRRPIRMVGIHRDIPERKQTELALKTREEQMRLFFERQLVGMAITSPQKGWLQVNDRLCRMLGFSREELNGLSWAELTYPEDLPADLAQFERLLNREIDEYSLEKRFICKDGAIIHTELSVGCVRLPDGSVDYVLALLNDITEHMALELSLKQINADLEQFAYVASHDLRQPLRMVTNYLRVIEKRLGPQLGDDLKTYLGYAVDGARRMDDLISGLLQFSRTGAASESLPVPLGEAIADALLFLAEGIRESGAAVQVAEWLPTVTGDRIELIRLFQNLIGNAIKYRSADRPPKVEIGWNRQPNGYLVWVKDNGMGIAPEHYERAFKVFQRLVSKGEFEGTGIGLSICKKIIEHHGGTIWIESVVGEGSVFFMTFPIRAKSAVAEVIGDFGAA